MSQPANDLHVMPATTTEGLDELFDVEVAEGQAMARTEMAEGQDQGQLVSLNEAAERLGITRRSALRLIQQGKLAGARSGQGQWLVKTASIEQRQDAKNQIGSHPTQVALEVAEGHGQGWPSGQDQGQIEIMKDLLSKIEVLTYRNGYLESQLQEREKDIAEHQQQIKLLTDSQHKAGWWARFTKWCTGQ